MYHTHVHFPLSPPPALTVTILTMYILDLWVKDDIHVVWNLAKCNQRLICNRLHHSTLNNDSEFGVKKWKDGLFYKHYNRNIARKMINVKKKSKHFSMTNFEKKLETRDMIKKKCSKSWSRFSLAERAIDINPVGRVMCNISPASQGNFNKMAIHSTRLRQLHSCPQCVHFFTWPYIQLPAFIILFIHCKHYFIRIIYTEYTCSARCSE